MAKRLAKEGDIFEIPLTKGRKAFGRYAFADKKIGPIVEVFDLIVPSNQKFEPSIIVNRQLLFPPIVTGVVAAVRSGMWEVIGNLKATKFKYSKFLSTFWNEKTGKAGVWFLWDGKRYRKLGLELPNKYKNLEFLIVWSPFDVVHRIETGEYIFPFRELIENNEYTPK